MDAQKLNEKLLKSLSKDKDKRTTPLERECSKLAKRAMDREQMKTSDLLEQIEPKKSKKRAKH